MYRSKKYPQLLCLLLASTTNLIRSTHQTVKVWKTKRSISAKQREILRAIIKEIEFTLQQISRGFDFIGEGGLPPGYSLSIIERLHVLFLDKSLELYQVTEDETHPFYQVVHLIGENGINLAYLREQIQNEFEHLQIQQDVEQLIAEMEPAPIEKPKSNKKKKGKKTKGKSASKNRSELDSLMGFVKSIFDSTSLPNPFGDNSRKDTTD